MQSKLVNGVIYLHDFCRIYSEKACHWGIGVPLNCYWNVDIIHYDDGKKIHVFSAKSDGLEMANRAVLIETWMAGRIMIWDVAIKSVGRYNQE